MRKHPQGAIVFVNQAQVPKAYSHEELLLMEEGHLKKVLGKVFTTDFSSAIVKDSFRIVEDKNEKIQALLLREK